MCGVSSLAFNTNEVIKETRKTMMIDLIIVFAARLIASILDVAMPMPSERIGNKSGATSIPPTITTALSSKSPKVVIKAEPERNRKKELSALLSSKMDSMVLSCSKKLVKNTGLDI